MLRFVREVRSFWSSISTLVWVDLKTNVATTRLGWVWWIVDPLIMMMIYFFMVRVVFNRGGENYHLFALCGIVMWQFFTRTLNITTRAMKRNRSLLRQINLPLALYVMVPTMVQAFFATIGIGIITVWNHGAIGMQTFAVFPLILLVGVMCMGLGLFLSVLNVYLSDTSNFVSYALRAGFFLSPILYPASRVQDSTRLPEIVKTIFNLNPLAWVMPSTRKVLLDGVCYNWLEYFLILGIFLVVVQCGLLWLRYHGPKIVKML